MIKQTSVRPVRVFERVSVACRVRLQADRKRPAEAGHYTKTKSALGVVVVALSMAACVRVQRPALQPTAALPTASLWEEPADLASRDLFWGPWGRTNAPRADVTYTFVARKQAGVNPGMTVTDPEGREWSVKQVPPGGLDVEGPIEVALSRILSALGYHQPAVYYLPAFTLEDDWGTHTEIGGRFRLKDPALKETGDWSWQDNPFLGTPSHQGLLVMMMMFNATDLKNSNNSLYERRDGDRIAHWYVARDLGAALGDTMRIAPLKGHADAFERHPFIAGVSNGHVDFAYGGWYRKLVENRITPADVVWASELLGRLSDEQWRSAFRAGGFELAMADRFIRKLQQKVEEGRAVQRLALSGPSSLAARSAR